MSIGGMLGLFFLMPLALKFLAIKSRGKPSSKAKAPALNNTPPLAGHSPHPSIFEAGKAQVLFKPMIT